MNAAAFSMAGLLNVPIPTDISALFPDGRDELAGRGRARFGRTRPRFIDLEPVAAANEETGAFAGADIRPEREAIFFLFDRLGRLIRQAAPVRGRRLDILA